MKKQRLKKNIFKKGKKNVQMPGRYYARLVQKWEKSMAPTEQDVKKWGVVEDFLHSTVYNTHFSDCENMHYDSFSAYSKGLDNS